MYVHASVGHVHRGTDAYADIDSWDAWSEPLETAVSSVTHALLDGTFYSLDELPAAARRSEVPHPPVHVTVARLQSLEATARRVVFTHLNHTNPLLWDVEVQAAVRDKGFSIARDGMQFPL